MASDLLIAFFQGFTGAGLFGKANLPGAPTEFIDSRSLEEFHSTGEFDDTLDSLRGRFSHSGKSPELLVKYPVVDGSTWTSSVGMGQFRYRQVADSRQNVAHEERKQDRVLVR